MAVTVQERKLLLDGEWIETGDWHGRELAVLRRDRRPRARRQAPSTHGRLSTPQSTPWAPAPGARARRDPRPRRRAPGERHDEVAQTISAEAGKPMKAARVEAERAVSTYTIAAVEARKLAGDVVPMDASQAGEGKLAFTMRVPIGIVGAITPFNFPLNLVAHKLAPALAAGCAVVLKPAGQTPLSALLLAELEEEAGLPPGWLNVLVGPSAEIGDVLVEDERVKLITFTGSGRRRLEAPRARGAQAREPRARQRDACDRRARTRTSRRRPRSSPRTRSPSPARAASPSSGSTSSASAYDAFLDALRPARSRRSGSATRPTRTPTSAR